MIITKTNDYTVEDIVATSFVIKIIEEAMKRFDTQYEAIVEVLKKLRYWEIFDDAEITTVGAHEGIEPVLKEIGELLK